MLNILMAPLQWVILAVDFIVGGIVERIIGHRRMPYFFVLPNMLIFVTFIAIPLILNFYFALTTGNSILPQNRQFVGLANYERIFSCGNIFEPITCREDVFWRAVFNTITFVIFEVPATIIIAMMIALALNREIALRGFFRSAFFYPVLLSPVVVALIWKWMLQERGGLLNTIIGLFGGQPISFLLSPQWMMFWIIFVSVWANVGFYALILLAGLQSIPPSLYEAAKIDGANEVQSFRKITFPLLGPTLLVVLVLSLIRGVQMFDHVYVLTGGGPGTATVLMVQYVRRTGFEPPNNWGLAAAASLILAVVLVVLTLAQLFANRRQTEAI
jgi:alpha-1,4-digalacturonate transport system permease protein